MVLEAGGHVGHCMLVELGIWMEKCDERGVWCGLNRRMCRRAGSKSLVRC